ncbi:MAG: hypothetical protein AB7E80_09335 [Hyphomicrobiaceae bacterium]
MNSTSNEPKGSVTHDKGYTVAPKHKCWSACMKGRAKTHANNARCSAQCEGRKVPASVTAGFAKALDANKKKPKGINLKGLSEASMQKHCNKQGKLWSFKLGRCIKWGGG